MNDIFLKIGEKIKRKETKQTEVAESLGIKQGYLSQILNGKSEPSETLKKLANILYGEEKQRVQSPTIEKINIMLEDMDESERRNVLLDIEKEKLFKELMKERQGKEAA